MKTRLLTTILLCMASLPGYAAQKAKDIKCVKMLTDNVIKASTCVPWDPNWVKDTFVVSYEGAWDASELPVLNKILEKTVKKLENKKYVFSFNQAGAICKEECADAVDSPTYWASNRMSCDDFCSSVLNNFIVKATEGLKDSNIFSTAGMNSAGGSYYFYSLDRRYRAESLPCQSYANKGIYNIKEKDFCKDELLQVILGPDREKSPEGVKCYKVQERGDKNSWNSVALMLIGETVNVMSSSTDLEDKGKMTLTLHEKNTTLCLSPGYHDMTFWMVDADANDPKRSKHQDFVRLEYTRPYEKNVSDLKTTYIPEIERLQKSLNPTLFISQPYSNLFVGLPAAEITDVYDDATDWLNGVKTHISDGSKQSAYYDVQEYENIRNRLMAANNAQNAVICAYNKLQEMGGVNANIANVKASSTEEAKALAQKWIAGTIEECKANVGLKSFQCDGPSCAVSGAGRISCAVGDIAINYDFNNLCN